MHAKGAYLYACLVTEYVVQIMSLFISYITFVHPAIEIDRVQNTMNLDSFAVGHDVQLGLTYSVTHFTFTASVLAMKITYK